jgi:cytochrome c biogenesis protein CcmG/thiol:disulfide interchange protein DsbE
MSNKMHYKTLILFSLLFCFCVTMSSGMSRIRKEKTAEEKAVKKEESAPKVPAPEFTLEDLSGRKVALSDQKGKLVFLNFWATWCPPCKDEMPAMQKVFEQSDKKRFVMLAVNVKEGKKVVKAFADKNGYAFPILLDTKAEVSRKYRVRSIPTTFIIDQEGNAIGMISGGREWEWDDFKPLLK